MADVLDIAAVDPVLEISLMPASLRCSGTLDARTRRYVLEAAKTLLASGPPALTIDMSRVEVADHDGATTFARIERMARRAGVDVQWTGPETERPRRSSHPSDGEARTELRPGARRRHPGTAPPAAS